MTRIFKRHPDGTPIPAEKLPEFPLDFESCLAQQFSWTRFDIAKSGTEAALCGEIDRTKEDVYSVPWTLKSIVHNLYADGFNITQHFLDNYDWYFDDLLTAFPDEIIDETHMGDLTRNIFYQINDLRADPLKWSVTQSKNPLAVREL